MVDALRAFLVPILSVLAPVAQGLGWLVLALLAVGLGALAGQEGLAFVRRQLVPASLVLCRGLIRLGLLRCVITLPWRVTARDQDATIRR